MHKQNIKYYQHPHNFHAIKESDLNKVLIVVIITLITMVAEIVLGWLFRSMALLSDGWHMATHASALTITLGAYYFAKKHLKDTTYAFGTWKMKILGAYTSAIFLLFVGIAVIFTSIERMFYPVSILYDQAIIVSVLGLLVNIACALVIRQDGHNHNHDHEHLLQAAIEHNHDHEHDLNMKSAYLHVLADAMTSVFAIVALVLAKFFNMAILDPLMGILSSLLIFRWAWGLLRDTSSLLLDRNNNSELIKEIKDIIESDDDSRISDLHLWPVGPDKFSCIITIVASKPKTIKQYKQNLQPVHALAHLAIEIVPCN
jgi:cation diffusion facilitator family transporter